MFKCRKYLTLLNIAFVIISIIVFNGEALAFTYSITERIVTWGSGYGEVYTNAFTYNWEYGFERGIYYPIGWDAYENTGYICDWDPETHEGTFLRIDMDTGVIDENSIGVISNPEGVRYIGSQEEYFIIERYGENFECYDYQFNEIWAFSDPAGVEYGRRSQIYRLSDGNWAIVVQRWDSGWKDYELWKLNNSGEIIGTVTLNPPSNNGGYYVGGYVFEITPDGEVIWNQYVDMYGGVFTWNEDGNLVRQEGGQMYEFPRGDDPNEDFFDAPWWQLKPYYDGTVYSFEYTEEGIRIKRYTYVPGLIPPVADFAFYPPQGPAPLSVTFQNYSCDEDGEIVRIECDWNGIHETIEGDPATFEHIFTEPGDNPFTLTVVDNDEQTDSWAGSVYVEPPSG